jgi:hypothetical protein
VPRSDRNAQTFFTNGDSGVVDRLYVDVVFSEEFVRGSFSESGIANEDGNNVRGTGASRNED